MNSQLSNPSIKPLDESGYLTTADNVHVDVTYSDVGSSDTVRMQWGTYEVQRKDVSASTASSSSPSTSFSVPPTQICDGTVTVWYSVQDKAGNESISEVIVQTIATGTRLLSAPEAVAVSAADSSRGFYATIPNNPKFGLVLQGGDTVTVKWILYQGNTAIESAHSAPFVIPPDPCANGYKTTALTPAPGSGQYMLLSYTLQRDINVGAAAPSDPGAAQTSLSQAASVYYQDLWPSGATLPSPIFTQADKNNVLDLCTLSGNYAGVGIPATCSIPATSTVTFTGKGFAPTTGQHLSASDWNSGPLTIDQTPYTNANAIPIANLKAVPNGGKYVLSYTAGGSTSPSTSVTIKQSTEPPPVGILPPPYFPSAAHGILMVPPSFAAPLLPIRLDDKSHGLIDQLLYFFGEGAIDAVPISASRWQSRAIKANPGGITVVDIPRSYLAAVPSHGTYTIYYRVGAPDNGVESLSTTVTLQFA